MDLNILWSETYSENDSEADKKSYNSVYDVSISPDNERLVVGAGSKILLYQYLSGDLIKILRAHKDTVNSVTFARDSNLFASASKDKMVIIWSKFGKGLIKFSHSSSVQRCRFNYVNSTLVSCCSEELCLCHPESKKVERLKLDSRPRAVEWTRDGSIFAISNERNEINLMDGETGELYRVISVPNTVWGVVFLYDKVSEIIDDTNVSIAACDISDCIRIFNLEGQIGTKEIKVDFEVMAIQSLFFEESNLLLSGGSRGKMLILNRDGVKFARFFLEIGLITGLSVAKYEEGLAISAGTFRGELMSIKMRFSSHTCVSSDKLAIAKGITIVAVISLACEKKLIIRTGSRILGISIYEGLLVVLHEKSIIIYEVYDIDSFPYSTKYVIRQKFGHKLPAISHDNTKLQAIVAFSNNIVLICDSSCIIYDTVTAYENPKMRKINLLREIVCVHGLPGYNGKEDFAVLDSHGTVYFINIFTGLSRVVLKLEERFYLHHVNFSVSSDQKYVSILVNADLRVIELSSKSCILEEKRILDAIFNSRLSSMLILVNFDNELLLCSIRKGKVSTFPTQETAREKCLKFDRNIIFGIDAANEMVKLTISFTRCIIALLSEEDLSSAFLLAKYTNNSFDWKLVADYAVLKLNWEVSILCYQHLGDYKLVWTLERLRHQSKSVAQVDFANNGFQLEIAEVCLVLGNFNLAKKIYVNSKGSVAGLKKFADLNLFHFARDILKSQDSDTCESQLKYIEEREADYFYRNSQYEKSIPLYISTNQLEKALQVAVDKEVLQELINVARKLPASDKDSIKRIADTLGSSGLTLAAEEFYIKVGEITEVIKMYMKQNEFDKALSISKQHENKFHSLINYTKGIFYTKQHDYHRALECFALSGKENEANDVLIRLIASSTKQKKFEEVGYYCYILSKHTTRSLLKEGYLVLARAYCIQAQLYAESSTPFSLSQKYANQYNMLCYIIYAKDLIQKASLGCILHIRYALQSLIDATGPGIPEDAAIWSRRMLEHILIDRKLADKLDHSVLRSVVRDTLANPNVVSSILCYRCSFTISSLQLIKTKYAKLTQLTKCPNCFHPPQYCFSSFETLPLVEFKLPDGITEQQVSSILKNNIGHQKANESLSFEVFLCSFDFKTAAFDCYKPLVISENVLENIPSDELFMTSAGDSTRYFKNVLPEVSISQCHKCETFFSTEEIEEESLDNGNACSICRFSLF